MTKVVKYFLDCGQNCVERGTCKAIKEWGKRRKKGHACGTILQQVLKERTIQGNATTPSVAFADSLPQTYQLFQIQHNHSFIVSCFVSPHCYYPTPFPFHMQNSQYFRVILHVCTYLSSLSHQSLFNLNLKDFLYSLLSTRIRLYITGDRIMDR